MTEPAIPGVCDRSPITGSLRPRRGPSGAELRAIYDEDPAISVRALAEEFGMAYGTVHRRLKEAGAVFRPPGGNNSPRGRPDDDHPWRELNHAG